MKIKLSDHFSYGKLIKFTLPTIIMMIFTSIYGVVDGVFVSNFVGSDAFAAVNLIMPVVMILGSVGFMIGTGGSAIVSKTLGEGKKEKAREYFSMLIYLCIVSGVALSAIGIIFIRPIAAALATGISQIVGSIIPIIYFLSDKSDVLKLQKARFNKDIIIKTCINGSSEMVTNMSMSLVNMLYNMQLMKYIGTNGVVAYGIIMYVGFIFSGTYLGYAVGSAPVISYHYGSDNKKELKNLFRKSITLIIVASLVMTGLAEVLAKYLAGIFVSYDKELLELTTLAIRIYSVAYLFNGLNIFTSSFFTALNNGAVSAAVSFLRMFVFQIAMIMILPLILGINGIWMAVIAAELLALFVSLIFIIINHKKYGYV